MNYLSDSNDSPTDVLIIPMNIEWEYPIKISTLLRNQGIKTQIYFEDKKVKNKISYAHRNKIKYVIFLGEDEIVTEKITLKDLESGNQVVLKLDEIISIIKDNVNNENNEKLIKIEN